MIRVEPYQNEYLQLALELNQRSDSTNRSRDTWLGNPMTGVIAFDDMDPVGIIPMEKRNFVIHANLTVKLLWVTGAHVEPSFRGQGIGTAMDRKIETFFYPEYKAVFVYRADENSPAYRWYKARGYHDLLPILILKKTVVESVQKLDYEIWDDHQMMERHEAALIGCFHRNVGSRGGFPERKAGFWADRIRFHYYRDFYRFFLFPHFQDGDLVAYALLGQTNIRDGVERIDILEWVAPESGELQSQLLLTINDFCWKHGLKEIRFPVSFQDPLVEWLRDNGFKNHRRFSLMGKLIRPFAYLESFLASFPGVLSDLHLKIQTPENGEITIGTGKRFLTISADDRALHEILMGRCQLQNACEDGKIALVEGSCEELETLSAILPFHEWKYFHFDYL